VPREGITEKVAFKSRSQRLQENKSYRYWGERVVGRGTAEAWSWSTYRSSRVASVTREG